MKRGEARKHLLGCWAGALLLVTVLVASGCAANKTATTETAKLKVVTTSMDIADVVRDIGGNNVEVENIIPPGQCPGHFDVKPQSIQVLSDANLFMLHDYDQQMQFSDQLIDSVGNTKLKKIIVEANQQTLMVPALRLSGIDQITAALVQADPQDAATYQANATKLKDETNQVAVEQKKRLDEAGASRLKVIVAGYQAGFAKWAGLDVIGVYPPDISPDKTKELIDLGRQQAISLVVDNLQSPNKVAAEDITKELKVQLLTLSNFPGGLPGTVNWSDSFVKNVDLVLEQCKGQ